jgi:hypothetical protein
MSADATPALLAGLTSTIGLEEAATLLRMAPSTLRKRAAAGKVPGYRPARQWVFLPEEIAAYLQASRPACRFVDIAILRTGGSSRVERSASQLAQQIRAERKKLTLEQQLEAELRNLKPRLAVEKRRAPRS